jgi:hypothetical protein
MSKIETKPTTTDKVLIDLFSRLPTLYLAFSVRGASVEWRDLIDNNAALRRALRRRAAFLTQEAQKKQSDDPFYDLHALDDTASEDVNGDLQRCVALLAPALLQWDCEAVFRRYRQASLRPLAQMSQFLSSDASSRNGSDAGMPDFKAAADEVRKSLDAVQMRVLHDCNDRSAEQHILRLRNNAKNCPTDAFGDDDDQHDDK